MEYKQFENKVKSMTAHDIIMAMVEGLRNPRTVIDMKSFGHMEGVICYGGAATNAILHIMEASKEEVEDYVRDRGSLVYRPFFVYLLEVVIDRLRRGDVYQLNRYATNFGIAQINPIPGVKFPYLDTDYTEEELQAYVILAEYQLTAKN